MQNARARGGSLDMVLQKASAERGGGPRAIRERRLSSTSETTGLCLSAPALGPSRGFGPLLESFTKGFSTREGMRVMSYSRGRHTGPPGT